MGVYHFMGLGRSPGAVTAAISYLAARFERYNGADQMFFATSGEFKQEAKRGDVQGIVLFTTIEVIEGIPDGTCLSYMENRIGKSDGKEHNRDKKETMTATLQRWLPRELRRLAGGRQKIALFWCVIDRADPLLTFERAATVMHAAKPPGEVGKEVWINLTGGSNTVNMALQLATSLLGGPARLYYLLSENPSCLYHTVSNADLGTERDTFWVEIPVVHLQLDSAGRAVLDTIAQAPEPMTDKDLLSRLKRHQSESATFCEMEPSSFRRDYLQTMMGQQLVQRLENDRMSIGQQWTVLKRYYEIVTELPRTDSRIPRNLEQLAQAEDWLRVDALELT